MVGRRGQPTQAHARDGAGRGGEPARADEVDAKTVWVRQGGGARYILFNGREGQAGEEVGVTLVLVDMRGGSYKPKEIPSSVGCVFCFLLSCRFAGGTDGQ